MINFDVLIRKSNLGSDRGFIDNFDFIYPDNLTKRMFAIFFAIKMSCAKDISFTVIRWLIAVTCVIPIWAILAYLQLTFSLIVTFFRLIIKKNLFNDSMFIVIYVLIHYLLIFPFILTYGDINYLNLYYLKLPSWVVDLMLIGQSSYN